MVAEARAREVHGRVVPFEGSGVDGGRVDVPRGLARPGHRTHQAGRQTHRADLPAEDHRSRRADLRAADHRTRQDRRADRLGRQKSG